MDVFNYLLIKAKMENKKNKKQKKSKVSFASQLAEKLRASDLGKVVKDKLSDNSAVWVSLRIKDMDLVITFDGNGEKIESVELWQDVVEVTDHKKIFGK